MTVIMERSVKLIIPFLKVKSNVVELAEEETSISFRKSSAGTEVVQVIFLIRKCGI